jgi:hypothetical protein
MSGNDEALKKVKVSPAPMVIIGKVQTVLPTPVFKKKPESLGERGKPGLESQDSTGKPATLHSEGLQLGTSLGAKSKPGVLSGAVRKPSKSKSKKKKAAKVKPPKAETSTDPQRLQERLP